MVSVSVVVKHVVYGGRTILSDVGGKRVGRLEVASEYQSLCAQLFECGPSRVCGWSVLSVKQSFSPRLQLISSRGRSNSLNSDDLHCSTFLSILFESSCRNSVVQW